MDIWVALAAASADYLAKHWKKVKRDVESSSEFPSGDSKFVKPESPPSMGRHGDKRCPLRRLAPRKRLGEDVPREREQAAQSASSSGENLYNFDHYRDCNVLSISTLSPAYLQSEDQAAEGLRENANKFENTRDSFHEPPSTEMSTSYGFTRNRISLRSRKSNMQFVTPLSSLESCLMAQLYREHTGMEEYVLSSVPSQSSPALRPFCVTDGRRIISGGGYSFSLPTENRKNELRNQISSAENETVLGVPPLPYVGSLELPRVKVKMQKGLGRKLSSSSKMINAKHFDLLTGSSHGALLFGLGLSVGLISSFLANKREVEKLNDLLEQTENLVQDLQDELEMKDALTVKELAIEDYSDKSASNSFCSQQNWDGSRKYCGKELLDQKAEEDSESVSKIEAELQAELERLELNMNSLSLERRLSSLVELDPDFIPEITCDKLGPDMFGRQAKAQPYADCDGSGTSTPHSANYAVSPRELTLRLHEVIQSRLEERVKELETALENSHRKVQLMDSERETFFRDLSLSDLRSLSYEDTIEDQPVVINLSGEALDAYNEAYGAFAKLNELEEADLTSGGKVNTLQMFDQNGGESSPALVSHEVGHLDEHLLWGDESENGHDEVEVLLIKQIVEKTRKGSSVILNAKKGLFSGDECEQ
ncbi:hypothetical protein RHSIM_Rhsim12G0148200 [Rhododendron simsii]|uniref:Uncharacterized protein n=1 Tax=Rhododendron simsii TaxID=118357 RepID=A0A834G4U5_RHOSS|nr:hypothetical protein RHSIM_Rhsim12G0148200 [Rhododendron simsii]